MDYLKINGKEFPYGNDFTMTKVPNIVNEIVTLSGETIADINGWKFADTELNWDYLKHEELIDVLDETNPTKGTFDLTFIDSDQEEVTVKALRKGNSVTKTQFKENGTQIVWTGIKMSISFPGCYR